jgi:hypothetical protein
MATDVSLPVVKPRVAPAAEPAAHKAGSPQRHGAKEKEGSYPHSSSVPGLCRGQKAKTQAARRAEITGSKPRGNALRSQIGN